MSRRSTTRRAARPVLSKLMHEFGASIIMERGSVFFSSNASDITDEAIRMIDAEIGDGSDSDLLDEDTTDPDAETNTETNTGQP